MADQQEASARYAARETAIAEEIARATLASTRVSLGRVVSFLLTVTFLGVYAKERGLAFLVPGLVALTTFIALVVLHNRIEAGLERAKAAALYVSRGKKRLLGELASLPSRGQSRLAQEHPYASDLDIFGPSSVLAVLDVLETDLSEARLGEYLASPAPLDTVKIRQGAARELSAQPQFAEDLFVLAPRVGTSADEAARFFAFCRDKDAASPVGLVAVAYLLPLVTISLLVLSPVFGLPGWAWMASFALHYVVGFRGNAAGAVALEVGASGTRLLGGYSAMIERTVSAGFTSEGLAALTKKLGGTDREGALVGLAKLRRLAAWAEARENGFFKIFLGPLVLFDLHLGFALQRWQRAYGENVDRWLDALSDVTALTGLGTFAFENPQATFPELVSSGPCFEAEGLAHPLLPPSRVPNDVVVEGPGHALLVTGSNMSGKSTLMRSMGVAAVMALAGAPVLATRLRVSHLVVRTSMRIKDSLSSGVSHFYAELLALRRVVESADRGEAVFFLLDEILHGTNSRERHLGAKGVILHLLDKGALGAVSTHDLGLADLVDEGGSRVRPVHLVEQTENGKMTFDHKLRDGFLTSGNALRLMRDLGLPVPADPR